MRSAEDIRKRAHEALLALLEVPGMFGVGQGYECIVRAQLDDLAFIDSRETELSHEFELLRQRGPWSQFGTWGALASVFGSRSDFTPQLAAIYAQIAARLGYFVPARRMTAVEWERAGDVAEWATAQPRCVDDVKERYGAPSYEGNWPGALGYAGPSDDEWLYFFSDSAQKNPDLELLFLPPLPQTRRWVDLRPKHDGGASPEEAYRRFMLATLTGDRASILPLIVVHEDPSCLWEEPYPNEVASGLAGVYAGVQINRISTGAESVVLHSGVCPVPLTVVHDGAQWRIEPDPLIRMRIQAARANADEEKGAS